MDAYQSLSQRFERIDSIGNAVGVLDWDAAVIMPKGASAGRSDQSAVLRGMAHELLVAKDVGGWLAQAREQGGLDEWQRANLREMASDYAQASALPADLVEACARANAACEMTWREARANSDFAAVRGALSEVLNLQLRCGEARSAALGGSVHDALLAGYNTDVDCAAIDALFADVERELPAIIGAALEAQERRPPPLPFDGPFPVEAQKQIGASILRALGFDFERGRFDVSLHPFCGGATNDVRITTRYDEADFTGALSGLMHEGGHALYEQQRPQQYLAQPVGRARGMAMHESQSLLSEWHVGLGLPFLTWLSGAAKEAFGKSGPQWSPPNFQANFARIKRGLIRVEADEATYPAHILLRHGLERAMISGDLKVADLPGAFNEGMARHVGVTPPDDRRGCLQDIHWYAGLWGYFPSYGVGAIIAAQLFGAARAAISDLDARLSAGDVSSLQHWLGAHVHSRASSASTMQIVADATGAPLTSAAFLAHLRARYPG